MARSANSATVDDATPTEIYPTDSLPCEEFWIRCDSGSAVPLEVRVQNVAADHNIHDDDDFVVINAGDALTFAASVDNPINSIRVDGSGGTATYSWSVTKA